MKTDRNLEELPSGSYRYKKQINGKLIRVTFDHKPSDAEIALAIAEQYHIVDERVAKQTFEVCCIQYISINENILSPSTIRGYNNFIENALSDTLKATDIHDITRLMIQNEINTYALKHKPKTVKNYHGFLSTVLKMYRPDLHLTTSLPKVAQYEAYVLSEEEVKKILEASKGTKYHIPFQLGVLGMRRSEVAAATIDDLDGNYLSINKVMIPNKENKWVIKHITKTEDGMRKIYLPDSLRDEIIEQGYIFKGVPNTLKKGLNSVQKQLGLPCTRFHDLRVFYATYAHSMGTPDAVILANGGWRSDYTMKKVYRKALDEDKKKFQEELSTKLFG